MYKDSNNNPQTIDKKFHDELFEFIHSVESEIDIMLPESESLQFLSYCKIIDYLISQKLSKNIIIKMLCPFDEKVSKLIKQIIPFIGYKSIKLSSSKTVASSLLFIRDKQDVFSFSIDIQQMINKTKMIMRIISEIVFFLLMTGCIQKCLCSQECSFLF